MTIDEIGADEACFDCVALVSLAREDTGKQLAANMRQARLRSELSIAQIARLAGVSRPAMSRYLSGERCPDAITLKRFADITGLSPDELLSGIR